MSIDPKMTLLTARFRLRQPILADVPAIFAATRVAGFNDGMQWDPPETEQPLIDRLPEIQALWKAGTAYVFSIEWQTTSEFAGRIAIRHMSEPKVWDVGFFTHPLF